MGKCFRVAGKTLMLLYGNDCNCEKRKVTSIDKNIKVFSYDDLWFNSCLFYGSYSWFIKCSNSYLFDRHSHTKKQFEITFCLLPLINMFKVT